MANYPKWEEALEWEENLVIALQAALAAYLTEAAPDSCMKECIKDSWDGSLKGSLKHTQDIKQKDLRRHQVKRYLKLENQDLDRLKRFIDDVMKPGAGPTQDTILEDWILTFEGVIDGNQCLRDCIKQETLAEAVEQGLQAPGAA